VTGTINLSAYSDALVVLATAGIIIPLVRRWGFNPIFGYLGAGALLGPLGLGSLIQSLPVLAWFTVVDARNVKGIADLGVVFLFFLIGLELSWQRLTTMRRLVFGLGALQVIVSSVCIATIAAASGQGGTAATILGTTLSLSSTAIVLEILSNQGRLSAGVGRSSFAILLAQDIAVIPILMFISIVGESAQGSLFASIGLVIVQALAAIALIVLAGRLLARPLFRLVAAARSSDLFVAAVLFVIVGAGVIANRAGMSMALGAFVAGLLLAETEFDKAIQSTVEPFKGLLLGIFFFTVGMNIDFRNLLRDPGSLAFFVFGLISLKVVIATILGRLFRLSWPTAVETGLLMGPGGEFAFVGIALATSLGLVRQSTASFVLAGVSVTMVATPLMSMAGRRLGRMLRKTKSPAPELAVRPPSGRKHAIVVGYGRVGKMVIELLREQGVPSIATDYNALTVARDRREGGDVYFGDASNLDFLKACGLQNATGVIITINEAETIDRIVQLARAFRPDLLIVARARDAQHARHLYAIGATDAVPETIEASLQLSEAALVGLGVAMGPAIASIHEKRDVFRRQLQLAAHTAGRADSYAVRQKTLRRK